MTETVRFESIVQDIIMLPTTFPRVLLFRFRYLGVRRLTKNRRLYFKKVTQLSYIGSFRNICK